MRSHPRGSLREPEGQAGSLKTEKKQHYTHIYEKEPYYDDGRRYDEHRFCR